MTHGTHNAVDDPRNESILIHINGKLFTRSEAQISVFDSGYLVGDGVWEALRLHEGVLVFADEHWERLWQGAATIGMKLPFGKRELEERVMHTLAENKMHDGVHVRIMITRGIKKTPSQDPRLTVSGPNLVIIPEFKKASDESRQQGVRLFTSTIRRGSPDYLDPRLNCHSKLHEVQALIQALEAGADEALMLDIHGFVSTCNATNFFIVTQSGEVWTSTGQYCMKGITRSKILLACQRLGIPYSEKNFSLFDVYGAAEAFVTGSFGGLTPVTEVDGRPVGKGPMGPVSQKLSTAYQELIHEAVQRAKNG